MSAFFFRSNLLRKYASLNHGSFVCGYKLIHHDTNNKLYVYYNRELITIHDISEKNINYKEDENINGIHETRRGFLPLKEHIDDWIKEKLDLYK